MVTISENLKRCHWLVLSIIAGVHYHVVNILLQSFCYTSVTNHLWHSSPTPSSPPCSLLWMTHYRYLNLSTSAHCILTTSNNFHFAFLQSIGWKRIPTPLQALFHLKHICHFYCTLNLSLFSYMPCTSLTHTSATPDFLKQYHCSSLGTSFL